MPLLSPLISKVIIHMSPQELQPSAPSKIAVPSSSQSPATTQVVCERISSRRAQTATGRIRRVTFKPMVTVRSIPHFNRYPPAMKKKIWNSSAEIYWNAQRNRIEFQAEGCDWRNVVTEDQMHVDVVLGKLVHPCHVSSSQQDPAVASRGGDMLGGGTLFPTRKIHGELVFC